MLTDSQEILLKSHREIDLFVRNNPLPFVSGWSTTHPVKYDHLYLDEDSIILDDLNRNYNFMADDEGLMKKVHLFHERVDGKFPDGCDVFIGAGSSPIISSVMILLSQIGVREIFYISPIYHVYYYLAKTLGIRMRNVEKDFRGLSEENIIESLPNRKITLLITDPSWIFGRFLSEEFWLAVSEWQRQTGSLIIIDGTFQYTKWDGMVGEFSSKLDPEHTFRLVCPTKSLCIHGVRFAYLILPNRYTEDLGYAYCKLVAATSIYDIRAAHLMMNQLNSAENNRGLTAYIESRYKSIIESKLMKDIVAVPNSTYYVFGKFNSDLSEVVFMNNKYFELNYPDDFIRVNILSPDLSSYIDD